jgi:hypothetical protein
VASPKSPTAKRKIVVSDNKVTLETNLYNHPSHLSKEIEEVRKAAEEENWRTDEDVRQLYIPVENT